MKFLIATLIVSVGLVACAKKSGDGSDSGSSSSGSQAGFQEFQVSFYAYVNKQGCATCHSTAVAPYFAQSSVSGAYGVAKPYVTFSSPGSSIFITKAGDGHCGTAACTDTTSAMSDALTAWASAELSGSTGTGTQPSGAHYQTARVAIPSSLPSLAATPKVVRFQLSGLGVASLTNAIAEVEIQLANSGEYRINNLKIAGNTAAVHVTGVHVYINAASSTGIGSEDAAQGMGWVSTSATAASSSVPSPLPTGPMTTVQPFTSGSIQAAVQSTSDVMTLGFDTLQ